MPVITDQEMADYLRRLIRGDVTWKVVGTPWSMIYMGDVEFVTSDGWRITAFNDVGRLDYVFSATSPDGKTHTFDMHSDADAVDLLSASEQDAIARLAADADDWRESLAPGRQHANPRRMK